MKNRFTRFQMRGLAVLLGIFLPSLAMAGEAPQILTSDLVVKQIMTDPEKVVTFVLVDQDKVVKVSINGKEVEIIPGDTVVVTRKFRFEPGKTQIEITATDEEGNSRSKSFLVGYKMDEAAMAKEEAPPQEEDKKSDINTNVVFALASERDTNPTNDTSYPVKLGDLDVQGVIPDEEQEDTRTNLYAVGSLSKGAYNALVGVTQLNYSKAENDFLDTLAIFLGGGTKLTLSETWEFSLNYLFIDINVGGGDYAQNHKLTPGFKNVASDQEGSYTHLLAFEQILKSFADSSKNAGSQSAFKWQYDSLDPEKQDNYRMIILLGQGDNGTADSENQFLTYDNDWTNKWISGLRLDFGLGLGYRKYANQIPLTTALGDTRVDLPFRFSTKLGYEFNPMWSLMYGAKYVANISSKTNYVRTVHGLTLSGGF